MKIPENWEAQCAYDFTDSTSIDPIEFTFTGNIVHEDEYSFGFEDANGQEITQEEIWQNAKFIALAPRMARLLKEIWDYRTGKPPYNFLDENAAFEVWAEIEDELKRLVKEIEEL